MSALSIVTIDSDLLHLKNVILRQNALAVPIEDPDYLKTCNVISQYMFEAMYASDGAAIAAPQVGISLRIVVMDPLGMDFGPHVLINPVIKSKSETQSIGSEGCLSIPKHMGTVSRSNELVVEAYDLKGKLREYVSEGWLARVFQHEIDHLDGVLYPDRLVAGEVLMDIVSFAHRRALAAMKKTSS